MAISILNLILDLFLGLVSFLLWSNLRELSSQEVAFLLYSVEGLNFSYTAINLHGFTLYALYNLYGFFIEPSQTGLVTQADLFFALHAFAAFGITSIQTCIYPWGKNVLSNKAIVFIGVQWIFILGYALLLQVYICLFS